MQSIWTQREQVCRLAPWDSRTQGEFDEPHEFQFPAKQPMLPVRAPCAAVLRDRLLHA